MNKINVIIKSDIEKHIRCSVCNRIKSLSMKQGSPIVELYCSFCKRVYLTTIQFSLKNGDE